MKISELQDELKAKKIDQVLLLQTNENKKEIGIPYFSEADNEFALLSIPQKGKATLYIAGFEKTTTHTKATKKAFEGFSAFAKQCKKKITIGINEFTLTLQEKKVLSQIFKKEKKEVKWKNIGRTIRLLQKTKTKEEIQRLKKAASIGDEIFKNMLKKIKSFNSEIEAAEFIENEAKKNGCILSFPPIVATGKNSALPHHHPSKKWNKGFCVIDMGVKYKGYCSDMTRTIYRGNPTKKEKEMYNTLLKIQENAIEEAKEGIKCGFLDERVQKQLGKSKRYFTHSLGHGVGRNVHEEPGISSKNNEKLKEGMCITIEPGVYFPKKWGIRIEDQIIITKGKAQVLTKSKKELIIIQ